MNAPTTLAEIQAAIEQIGEDFRSTSTYAVDNTTMIRDWLEQWPLADAEKRRQMMQSLNYYVQDDRRIYTANEQGRLRDIRYYFVLYQIEVFAQDLLEAYIRQTGGLDASASTQ